MAQKPKPKPAKKAAPAPKEQSSHLLRVAGREFDANVDHAIYAAVLGVLEALRTRAKGKPEITAFIEKAIVEVQKGGGQSGGEEAKQGPPPDPPGSGE